MASEKMLGSDLEDIREILWRFSSEGVIFNAINNQLKSGLTAEINLVGYIAYKTGESKEKVLAVLNKYIGRDWFNVVNEGVATIYNRDQFINLIDNQPDSSLVMGFSEFLGEEVTGKQALDFLKKFLSLQK